MGSTLLTRAVMWNNKIHGKIWRRSIVGAAEKLIHFCPLHVFPSQAPPCELQHLTFNTEKQYLSRLDQERRGRFESLRVVSSQLLHVLSSSVWEANCCYFHALKECEYRLNVILIQQQFVEIGRHIALGKLAWNSICANLPNTQRVWNMLYNRNFGVRLCTCQQYGSIVDVHITGSRPWCSLYYTISPSKLADIEHPTSKNCLFAPS